MSASFKQTAKFIAVMLLGFAVVVSLVTYASGKASATETSSRTSGLSYYAFGPLTTSVLSAYGQVGDGKYCKLVLNNADHQNTIRFIRLPSGEGPTFTLRKHEQRKICVKLGSSPNTHYSILLLGSEVTWSAGVWTPQNTHIHYANKHRHWDIVCSINPLKRPAVFNVRKASLSSDWHLADYTAHYVRPGHSVCLTAHQKPGVYMRLRSEWRRGSARSNQTYEIAPVYRNR